MLTIDTVWALAGQVGRLAAEEPYAWVEPGKGAGGPGCSKFSQNFAPIWHNQIDRMVQTQDVAPGILYSGQAMKFVLYSKPGCHLCAGLEAKLRAVTLPLDLEVRDITTRPDWFQRYQYEVPVLCAEHQAATGTVEKPLPRLSPRAPQAQVEALIQAYS